MFGFSNYDYQSSTHTQHMSDPPHNYPLPSNYGQYQPPYQQLPQMQSDQLQKMLPLMYPYPRPPEPEVNVTSMPQAPQFRSSGQRPMDQVLRQLPVVDAAQVTKFTEQDVSLLRQLLVVGEKHKWKQITKEINQRNLEYRDDQAWGEEEGLGVRNVSPTYVIKQYQNLLGLPKNQMYFGVLGSSLPYFVADKGWEELEGDDS